MTTRQRCVITKENHEFPERSGVIPAAGFFSNYQARWPTASSMARRALDCVEPASVSVPARLNAGTDLSHDLNSSPRHFAASAQYLLAKRRTSANRSASSGAMPRNPPWPAASHT
jgi:hypothetical protein